MTRKVKVKLSELGRLIKIALDLKVTMNEMLRLTAIQIVDEHEDLRIQALGLQTLQCSIIFKILNHRSFKEVELCFDQRRPEVWNDPSTVLEIKHDGLTLRIPVPLLKSMLEQNPTLLTQIRDNVMAQTLRCMICGCLASAHTETKTLSSDIYTLQLGETLDKMLDRLDSVSGQFGGKKVDRSIKPDPRGDASYLIYFAKYVSGPCKNHPTKCNGFHHPGT